ncbi:acyl carrier protein [Paenibacillus sp. HJL G12]|uniref:Acyl carrier protein n=1 Tax=Paenibacillus dendrobii TaxID=2691084 RepID=A0A7X3LIL1_9BACL|nr:acyl carrier protein [Paenibacillus dendrobii]MWV45365.1 acyl carrier protein [Paenibacillus dendrobii]
MNTNELFQIIVSHTREVLPELQDHPIQPEDRLADLGANSVDRAEIIMMTMDTLSLRIPSVELFGVNNIGELAEVLYAKLQTS